MAPTCSTETGILTQAQQEFLLRVAAASIRHGLQKHQVVNFDATRFETSLQEPGATFVTLRLAGQLRGCIGSLEATRPLISDVAVNAYAAAFSDPRFMPLLEEEYSGLEIHIAILTPPQLLAVKDEQELLASLQPGIDGLVLEEGLKRGTFLPAVWEVLLEPQQFLQQLKLKAGLTPNHWSDTLKVYRYRTISFGAKVFDLKPLDLGRPEDRVY